MLSTKPSRLASPEEETVPRAECGVLLVEDDMVDRRQVTLLLAKSAGEVRFRVEAADSLRAAARCLSDHPCDVVLLDLGLPDSSGLEGIQEVRALSPSAPIIVLTGLDDEDLGVQAIRSGAEDYLVKGPSLQYSLVRTIRHAIERRQMRESLLRSFDAQRVINHVLTGMLADASLPELFERTLDHLTAIPWLDLTDTGAIFLVDPESNQPQVQAYRGPPGLPPEACEQGFSEAATGTGGTTDRPAAESGAQRACRHYCVPIISGGTQLGTIQLTGGKSCRHQAEAEQLLHSLADVLGTAVEHRRAQEALRFKNVLLATQQEVSPDGILVVDENGRILSCNRRFIDMWDIPLEAMTTRSDVLARPSVLDQLTQPEEFLLKVSFLYQHRGETSHDEMALKDGRAFDCYSAPMQGPDNRYYGRVWHFHDISEMRRAQQQMKEAMEMKSQFLSVASHELRTPLTAIKESIAIVHEAAADKLDAEIQGFLDLAQRNIDRLSRLINDILDLQKLESGKAELRLQELDVHEVMQEVRASLTPLAERKGLRLSLSLMDHPPRIPCDRDKITQVLVNLVTNAIKFTETGAVTIATRREEEGLVVTVADTGPGIKQEDLSKLFQKFQQLESPRARKPGGTGLGLAICKQIVEKHTGRVWVDSELGVGSRFSFWLPAKSAKVPDGKEDIGR